MALHFKLSLIGRTDQESGQCLASLQSGLRALKDAGLDFAIQELVVGTQLVGSDFGIHQASGWTADRSQIANEALRGFLPRLSAEQLAQELGVSKATIVRLNTGVRLGSRTVTQMINRLEEKRAPEAVIEAFRAVLHS